MSNTISSRKAASILNVNESTIKRWSDSNILKCIKTAGGHRKFILEDIRKHAAAHDVKLPALSAGSKRSGIRKMIQNRNYEMLSTELEILLLKGDVVSTYNLLYNLYFSNVKTQEIFDHVIRTCMKSIGTRWKEKKLTVEEEHIASNTLIPALYQFEKSTVTLGGNGLTAICAGMEKESHGIGLLCVKIFLRQLGYDIVYPGTNLPLRSIINLIDEHKPSLLCVTTVADTNELRISSDLKKLKKKSDEIGTTLVIGGQRVISNNNNYPELNFCKTVSELSSLLKKKI